MPVNCAGVQWCYEKQRTLQELKRHPSIFDGLKVLIYVNTSDFLWKQTAIKTWWAVKSIQSCIHIIDSISTAENEDKWSILSMTRCKAAGCWQHCNMQPLTSKPELETSPDSTDAFHSANYPPVRQSSALQLASQSSSISAPQPWSRYGGARREELRAEAQGWIYCLWLCCSAQDVDWETKHHCSVWLVPLEVATARINTPFQHSRSLW